MFITLTDCGEFEELVNINSIARIETSYPGAVIHFISGEARTYADSYEEVKNMIDALTAPKLIMPACGGICED